MDKLHHLPTVFIVVALLTSCSDDSNLNNMASNPATTQAEVVKHNPNRTEQAGHGFHAGTAQTEEHAASPHPAVCPACATGEISREAVDLPAPLARQDSQTIVVELYTDELIAEMMPGVTYNYWTYNGKVPGPFIRVREGDQVEIRLRHGKPGSIPDSHNSHIADEHAAAGHKAHSIDLHAVIGPGGGAPLMQVEEGEEKSFRFKAAHPGIYVYHCASPHVPTHVANGMYGLILVEPAEGLAKVDREFYVMQGEFYTEGKTGEQGFQPFSKDKLLAERPEYFVFNGRVDALSGDRALKAKVGEKIRLFVGVGSHIASNFHIIGAVFDKLYADGAITSPPLQNVQTTVIAPGSAVMVEFTAELPGKYLLVDHSLARAFDKGALAELIVEGRDNPDLYQAVSQ